MELISVIVIFKNEENFLKDCVESILAQTYHNFELVLVDDASTDSSSSIALGFKDKRIRYFKNKKSLGIASSRNVGLSKARGKIIFFTDADCIVDKKWMTEGVSTVKKGYILAEGRTEYIERKPTVSDKIVQDLSGGEWMTCNIAYDSIIVKKVGKFSSDLGNMLEDRDFALRAMRYGKSCFNEKMLVHHQKKLWTVRSLFARHRDQGRSKVLMRRYHQSGNHGFVMMAFPLHLFTIICPPLLILKALRDHVKSFYDFKILLSFYPAYIIERANIWKTAFKEKIFII